MPELLILKDHRNYIIKSDGSISLIRHSLLDATENSLSEHEILIGLLCEKILDTG